MLDKICLSQREHLFISEETKRKVCLDKQRKFGKGYCHKEKERNTR